METTVKVEDVEKALDGIRPYLETDGGDVKVIEITGDNVLKLELLGTCGSCKMSSMTMTLGIEEAIKRTIPAIKKVEAVNLTPMDSDE